MLFAEILVAALKMYAAAGFLFGLLFVWIGVARIDSAAKGTGLGFRLIILPGAAAFWPALLMRWIRS